MEDEDGEATSVVQKLLKESETFMRKRNLDERSYEKLVSSKNYDEFPEVYKSVYLFIIKIFFNEFLIIYL